MVEVIKKRKWSLTFFLGILWLISNAASVLLYDQTLGGTEAKIYEPYNQVDIIVAEFRKDEKTGEVWFYFFANFNKLECDINSFRVVAKYPGAGVTPPLPFEDLDERNTEQLVTGTNSQQLDNRSTGLHTIRIRFKVDPDFEWIDFRTAHLCPNEGAEKVERVSKLFAHITGE